VSDDDELLQALGALERERDTAVAQWEALARGEVSRDEVVASRTEAGEAPEEVERVAALVSAESSRDWLDIGARALAADTSSDDAPPVSLESRRRPSAARWWAAGAVLLAAALAVLWFARPRPPVSTLPDYTLVVRNETVRTERGADTDMEPARYRRDSDVYWVLQPAEAVTEPLKVAIVAENETGEQRIFEPPAAALDISEQGVVRLRGTLETVLPLSPGRWTLRVLVGPSVPTSPDALEAGGPWSATVASTIDVLP